MVQDFKFYAPTKVVFGKDKELETGRLVKEFGGSRVLIHYGGGSAVRSGLLARVEQSLELAGIFRVSLGGVKPNPRISKAREGLAICRRENLDFILAIGGGSVIDSCKAIAYGLANDVDDPWKIYSGEVVPTACAPIGSVLTIAAAGSEMSDSSVLTNEDGWLKRGYNSDLCRPRFAVMNPELTYSLPAYQTACGCVDIILHTMERYFTHAVHVDVVDGLAEYLMRSVMESARILKDDPENYDARANVMWASSISHNDMTGDRSLGDWGCHQLEHELSGIYDVAHGAGLAAIWPSWARYVYKEETSRFVRFATQVMGVSPDAGSDDEIVEEGIRRVEEFYRSIDMPTSIRELGIDLSDEVIATLAEKCSFFGKRTIGKFKKLDVPDMTAIYRAAK